MGKSWSMCSVALKQSADDLKSWEKAKEKF